MARTKMKIVGLGLRIVYNKGLSRCSGFCSLSFTIQNFKSPGFPLGLVSIYIARFIFAYCGT